jgi:putative hemolysin
MLKLMTQIKETTQLKWNRVGRFKPSVQIHIELGSYIVKTADSVDDLLKIFRLRHEVFHREFREIAKPGLDIDRFDRAFDHLIIYHKPSDKIVGTYRLRTSEVVHDSYTALEFSLYGLYKILGPYLELGRACVHKEHRKGVVMSLLFRGIADYMNKSGAQILFGCSSIKVTQARESALVYTYLKQKEQTLSGFGVEPTQAFKMLGIEAWLMIFSQGMSQEQKSEAESLLPSLLNSYLKMGAKIASVPAYDKDFGCIDLLTVLNKEDLAASLVRRFQVEK